MWTEAAVVLDMTGGEVEGVVTSPVVDVLWQNGRVAGDIDYHDEISRAAVKKFGHTFRVEVNVRHVALCAR